MNLKIAFLSIFSLIAAIKAEALEIPRISDFGQIAIAGSACTQTAGEIREVQGVFQIPLRLNLKKAAGKSLSRGTCLLSVPVNVPQSYRLVISDFAALETVNLRKGNKSRLDLEIFKAGSTGKKLNIQHDASLKSIVSQFRLSKAGDLLALGCGESVNLRANLVAVLQGASEVPATVAIDVIRFKMRLEQCQN